MEGIDLRAIISTIEEFYTRQALSKTDGNMTQAARLLGMSRTTLLMRVKKSKTRRIQEPEYGSR